MRGNSPSCRRNKPLEDHLEECRGEARQRIARSHRFLPEDIHDPQRRLPPRGRDRQTVAVDDPIEEPRLATVEARVPETDSVALPGRVTQRDEERGIEIGPAAPVAAAEMRREDVLPKVAMPEVDPGAPTAVAAAEAGGHEVVGLGKQVSSGRIMIGTARYGGDWDCDRTAMPNLAYHIEKRVGFVDGAEALLRQEALDRPKVRR